MTRRAYVIHAQRVVFFWSPKAGNTSLAKWLVQGLWPAADDTAGMPPRAFLKSDGSLMKFPAAYRLVAEEGYDSFALVRNPYSRAVSAYVNKFVMDGNLRLDGFDKLEPFAARLYLATSGNDPSAPFSGVSFVQYLEHVAEKVCQRPPAEEPDLDAHWSTQVPFRFRRKGFKYGQIIKLETIDEDLAPAALRLGIEAPFPHLRRSRPEPGSSDDVSEVASTEILAARRVPSEANLLSDGARALIEQAYEIDFEMLGYPKSRGSAEATLTHPP